MTPLDPPPQQERTAPTLRWNGIRTELLWVYDGEPPHDALNVRTNHTHGNWAWLIRKGGVRIQMGTKSWNAAPGNWIISPRGEVRQEFLPGSKILSLHFLCQWPTGENLFNEEKGFVFESSRFPELEQSASRLDQLVSDHFAAARAALLQQEARYPMFLKLQQLFMQWLIDFYEAMLAQGKSISFVGDGEERIWRAAEYLHKAPLDAPFPVARLERETSLGRAQLDRLFSKHFGSTTREYWDQLRHEFAVATLESTTTSIKTIGYLLGFKQPSHFTKWFTNRLGVAPQLYRDRSARTPQFIKELHPGKVKR